LRCAAEGDYKHKIVQRGAVPPLIDMLANDDNQLREMAAFALGRLAQNSDNQAGIVAQGGLAPLLDLLETCQSNLQHNAAFALYGLSDNEDNLLEFVREGAVQRINECELVVQASKDCVNKLMKRLQVGAMGRARRASRRVVQDAVVEGTARLLLTFYPCHSSSSAPPPPPSPPPRLPQDKLSTRILGQILYVMQSSQAAGKQRIAVALAQLTTKEQPSGAQLRLIFLEKKGLDVLLDMVQVGGGALCRRHAPSTARLADCTRKPWSSGRTSTRTHPCASHAGPAYAGGHAARGRQVAEQAGGELRRCRPHARGRPDAQGAHGGCRAAACNPWRPPSTAVPGMGGS
jgi:hypothetical protein